MLARVVKIIFDLAVDREPVHMYVGCRHENGHLYPFVLEIFRFYGSFYDHHLAVGRSDNEVFTGIRIPAGGAEEANNHQEKPEAEDVKEIMEPGLGGKNMIQAEKDSNYEQKYYDNGLISFSVYRHPV